MVYDDKLVHPLSGVGIYTLKEKSPCGDV